MHALRKWGGGAGGGLILYEFEVAAHRAMPAGLVKIIIWTAEEKSF